MPDMDCPPSSDYSSCSPAKPITSLSNASDVAQQRAPGRTIIQTVACPPALRRGEDTPWSFSDFSVKRMLGEGQMSSVVHCTCNRSGLEVAVKMYHKDRMNSLNIKQVAREIEIHSSLCHPHIVQLFAAFEDKDGIYLVEEHAPKGDLFNELSRQGGYMQEAYVVKNVLQPFLSALSYLHGQGVLHRDIKPENVLLGSDGQVMMGDFGLAINLVRERPVSKVGTLDYMPPEIVSLALPAASPSKPFTRSDLERLPSYGLSADIWCTGILVYELLIGGPPFEADTKEETYTRILKMRPHLPAHLSENARDFVSQCLRKEPGERPTVLQLLRHPWVRTFQRANSLSPLDRFGLSSLPATGPPSPAPLFRSGSTAALLSGGSGSRAGEAADALTVLPSAASAPCLTSHSGGGTSPCRKLSFTPISAKFTPRGANPSPSGPGQAHRGPAGAGCAYGSINGRLPHTNSFKRTESGGAISLPSSSPIKQERESSGPSALRPPAAAPNSARGSRGSRGSGGRDAAESMPAGGGSTRAAKGDTISIFIGDHISEESEEEEEEGEGTIAAVGCAGVGTGSQSSYGATDLPGKPAASSDAGSKITIHVDAAPLSPTAGSPLTPSPHSPSLEPYPELIPAARGADVASPAGTAAAGTVTALAALKSKLGKVLLPGAGSAGQGKAVGRGAGPSIAQMLAPAPGHKSPRPSSGKAKVPFKRQTAMTRRSGQEWAASMGSSHSGMPHNPRSSA